MRIVQIIDSLEAGGAERMAVNYANALVNEISFSGLIATRNEGQLKEYLNKNVNYLFLKKRRSIDLQTLLSLRKYVKLNKVEVIHAHSTSFFLAFQLKLLVPSIQLIWHDHYGNSEFLAQRPRFVLQRIIPFFKGVIVVNHKLKEWNENHLKSGNVKYLPNFPTVEKQTVSETILNGFEGKRIVMLANLRSQKNHFLLLEVAKMLKISNPEWTFHLIGKDFYDSYSRKIKETILKWNLEKNVFLYGSKNDVNYILKQADIAVLTSDSEGLPVALLEYGLAKKAVVLTNVGEIDEVIENDKNGYLVESGDKREFYNSVIKLIHSDALRENFSQGLYEMVLVKYSEKKVIKEYLKWLQKL